MVKVESFVELSLRKDKFETSKPNEMRSGEGDHEEEWDKMATLITIRMVEMGSGN